MVWFGLVWFVLDFVCQIVVGFGIHSLNSYNLVFGILRLFIIMMNGTVKFHLTNKGIIITILMREKMIEAIEYLIVLNGYCIL